MELGSWEVVYGLRVAMAGAGLLAAYCAMTLPVLLWLAVLGAAYYAYNQARDKAAGTVDIRGRAVLITGCDTGFGQALARHLHGLGCHVVATVLRPEGEGAAALRGLQHRMTVLPLDVASDDSVATCLEKVKELYGETGLWGLVNNAGHNFLGDVELTTMKQYLMVGNINMYGMVRTTKAFLPLLRQAKGRIVNVTSVKGCLSTPMNAAYNMTKFAGETFSEITRMEVRRFGVKVSVVEPGNFGGATGCINKQGIARIESEFRDMWAEAGAETKEVFSWGHLEGVVRDLGPGALTTCPTLTPVLAAITHALASGEPHFRYLVDGSNSLLDKYCVLARLRPYLPYDFFETLVLLFFPYRVET